MRNDIFIDEDLLFVEDRLIIPSSMKQDFLNQLHESHMGINKTQKRAKLLFHWPGMSTEIENMILRCYKCQSVQKSHIKEPMIAHEIPDVPFEKVGCDIFEYGLL